jgi:hypothetical protein
MEPENVSGPVNIGGVKTSVTIMILFNMESKDKTSLENGLL